jgi:mannose-6-phosphate isomerase-like protein (cupin superfamily)
MNMLGNIEIITPSCNLTTIQDGRGGIFTWIPKDPILEFNMLYFLPGKVRGNHYHPEFVEYFLIVDGSGIMMTKDEEGKELNLHASKGTCFRTPAGTSHTFNSITETTCISMLTKPWDECKDPIIHDHISEFDAGYLQYKKDNNL